MKMRFWCYAALVGAFVIGYALAVFAVSFFTQDSVIATWIGRIAGAVVSFLMYVHFQNIAEKEYEAELRRDLDF